MPKCSKGWKSMKFKLNYLKIALYLGASVALSISHAGTLQTLTDEQLSESMGQALMSLSYLAPTDSTNPMKNIVTDGKSNTVGFYKLGLEAELELNTNIRNLQLGCGGVNGANACDIDIKNLALSGLPDSYDADGNPVFNNGRTSKSAEITNQVILKCQDKGLILFWLLFEPCAIRITPPLTISEEEIKEGCQIIIEALDEVAQQIAANC